MKHDTHGIRTTQGPRPRFQPRKETGIGEPKNRSHGRLTTDREKAGVVLLSLMMTGVRASSTGVASVSTWRYSGWYISRPLAQETEIATTQRTEEELRGVGVFWEGPEGAEYGFGGSAEDEIIAHEVAPAKSIILI